MAWTPYKRTGFELGDRKETDFEIRTPNNSTTKKYTGSRSMQTNGEATIGYALPNVNQVRVGFFLNHNGLVFSSGRLISLFRWNISGVSTNVNNVISPNLADNILRLQVGGSLVHSVSPLPNAFTQTDQWFAIGVVLTAGVGDGWVSLYLDGERIMYKDGLNIDPISDVYVMGGPANSWGTSAYVDDLFVDFADGSELDEAPEPLRFVYATPNGDVGTPGWSRNTGSTNWQQVDEIPHDSETTYVHAAAAGLVDVYDVATPTVPEGYSVAAVIPIVQARRASTTELLKVGLSDGTNVHAGDPQVVSSGYLPVSQRYETKPAGGAWTVDDLIDIKVRIESAGTF